MLKAKKVLVIEDSRLARLQVRDMLEKNEIEVFELGNADKFFEATWLYMDIDLLILDINLPGMDGLTALSRISADSSLAFMPVVMFSGLSDRVSVQKALHLGAKDFICKPLVEKDFIQKVKKVLAETGQWLSLQKHAKIVDTLKQLFISILNSKEVPLEQLQSFAAQCSGKLGTVKMTSLLKLPGKIEDYTYRHSLNVGFLAGMLGKWLGYSGDQLEEAILAGLLHDLGKTQIPPHILNKPSRLTTSEMDIMKKHPTLGHDLIKSNKLVPDSVLQGILQHHERLDGSGYPHNARSQNISTYARVIAVVDIYDAMTSNSVYRQAQSPFFVIEELFNEMVQKLDPEICTVFLNNVRENLVEDFAATPVGTEARLADIKGKHPINPLC